MSGGSKSSKNTSRPLNAKERMGLFEAGIEALDTYGASLSSLGGDEYKGPRFKSTPNYQRIRITDPGHLNYGNYSYSSPGAYKGAEFVDAGEYQKQDFLTPEAYQQLSYEGADYQQLNNGDYDSFQEAMLAKSLAPLQEYEAQRREEIDQDLADRGIYTSTVATDVQGDLTDDIADSYQQAGAEAALARYQMEQEDLAQMNQMAQREAENRNSFAADQAQMAYQSEADRINALNALNQQENQFAYTADLDRANQENLFNQQEGQFAYTADQANAEARNAWEADRNAAVQQSKIDRANAINNARMAESQFAYNARADQDLARNAFNQEEARQRFDSSWRDLDTGIGLWNGTSGNIGSSKSSGWSIGL